jgi:hypothetical protein
MEQLSVESNPQEPIAMSRPKISRRALVRAATALSAVTTLPAGAAAIPDEPDPIFAAMEDRRATIAAHNVALKDSAAEERANGEGLPQVKWRERVARNADAKAIRTLFSTVPTTLAGVLALVRYVAECDAAGDDIWMVYMTDEDEPVYGYQALFASVIAALEKLSART